MKGNRHLIAGLLVLLLASASRADSVFTGDNFTGTGAVVFDAMGLNPFNPALGTLDSVHVQITGNLHVQGIVVGSSPYIVEQQFFGLAGRFFEFDSPARFIGTATGISDPQGQLIPTPFQHNFTFDYDFTFTAATDLIGFIPVNSPGAGIIPPTSISAQRSDFLPWIGNLYELDMQADVASGPVSTISSSGAVLIEYRYTPAPPITPTPSAAAAGMALLALVSTARRREY